MCTFTAIKVPVTSALITATFFGVITGVVSAVISAVKCSGREVNHLATRKTVNVGFISRFFFSLVKRKILQVYSVWLENEEF